MTGVNPGNVQILNVTAASSRRRLAAAAASSGISTLYVVALASHYSLSDLQSQLVASTSSGFFNQQLTANAEKFGAAGFVNATSTGIIILTVAPTAAPSNPPSPSSSSSSNNNNLSAGAIAGITIMSVVVAAAILAAVYYFFYYDKAIMLPSSSPFKSLPKLPSFSLQRFWTRRENFDPFNRGGDGTTRESQDSPVTFVNPISASRQTRSNRSSEFTIPTQPGGEQADERGRDRDRDRESASSTQGPGPRTIWSIFPSSFTLRQSWSRPQQGSEDRGSSFGNKDRPVVFDNPIAANKRGTTLNPLRSPQSNRDAGGGLGGSDAGDLRERDRERDREKDKVEFVNPSFVNHPRMKKPKKEDIDIFL